MYCYITHVVYYIKKLQNKILKKPGQFWGIGIGPETLHGLVNAYDNTLSQLIFR